MVRVVDVGLARGVINRRVDALDAVQLLLDPGRVRGARHALDIELDSCRGHELMIISRGYRVFDPSCPDTPPEYHWLRISDRADGRTTAPET